jgi:hypothetical protein
MLKALETWMIEQRDYLEFLNWLAQQPIDGDFIEIDEDFIEDEVLDLIAPRLDLDQVE